MSLSSTPQTLLEFFAPCSKGLEQILASELRFCGAKRVRPLSSGVAFFGQLETGLRAALWSRTASRILLIIARGIAKDSNSLYQLIYEVPWEDHLLVSSSIAIDAHGTNQNLRDTRFIAVRAKDALCDRLRERRGARPSVAREHPDLRINLTLRGEKATLALDLSGEPLHRRGYRVPSHDIVAPLRETLAAGMLLLAEFTGQDGLSGAPQVKEHDVQGIGSHEPGGQESFATPYAFQRFSWLLDPLCGSGTLAIEAALLACDRAPGLLRSAWGHTHWLGGDAALWDALLDEADARAETGDLQVREQVKQLGRPYIWASDLSALALAVAGESARKAGVAAFIHTEVCDVTKVQLPRGAGLVVTNPPYGERMASRAQLPALYAALRTLAFAGYDGAQTDSVSGNLEQPSFCVISSDPVIDSFFPVAPAKIIETYNGPLEAQIRFYSNRESVSDAKPSPTAKPSSIAKSFSDVKSSPDVERTPDTARGTDAKRKQAVSQDTFLSSVTQHEQFANRLRKMAKHRAKWAGRAGVTNYRVYDADLPDYNVAIDVYSGAAKTADEGRRWLVIAEYKPPMEVDESRATERLAAVLNIAPEILQVPVSQVYCKQRRRERGGSQYASESALRRGNPTVQTHQISEGDLHFEVDFASHLDTGLFLDHRQTRALLREKAANKETLNLFAYTGSASVYLAAGGARGVTTVDLSRGYLEKAQRNMANNGFTGQRYCYEQADAIRWAQDHRHDAKKYDLIFCDPPTFSNSSSMGGRSWDVQRDHAELLIALSRMLAPAGELVFSTNLRNFHLEEALLSRAGVAYTEITATTIPPDFQRPKGVNPMHRCYLLQRVKS